MTEKGNLVSDYTFEDTNIIEEDLDNDIMSKGIIERMIEYTERQLKQVCIEEHKYNLHISRQALDWLIGVQREFNDIFTLDDIIKVLIHTLPEIEE